MNQTDVLLMLAEQAKGRQSIDPDHALALLCRQIADLDPHAPEYGDKLGELLEIGVTLWHLHQRVSRRQQ